MLDSIKPVVVLLTGYSGTGKTHLLQKFIEAKPGEIQLFTPERSGAAFSHDLVDWQAYSAIALDDVTLWDQATLSESITQLEHEASTFGKTLILVSAQTRDFDSLGIKFESEPFQLKLTGRQQAIDISYFGTVVQFSGFDVPRGMRLLPPAPNKAAKKTGSPQPLVLTCVGSSMPFEAVSIGQPFFALGRYWTKTDLLAAVEILGSDWIGARCVGFEPGDAVQPVAVFSP